MRAELIDGMVTVRIPEKAYAEQWEAAELAEDVKRLLNLELPIADWAREEGIDEAGIHERLTRAADAFMAAKAANFGPELMRYVEKTFLLQLLDQVWKEHLLALDHLRQGIVLRAYGQRDPLNEYKTEAFALFNAMLAELKERVTAMLARADIGPNAPPQEQFHLGAAEPTLIESHPAPDQVADMGYGMATLEADRVTVAPTRTDAVNPNDPDTWHNSPRNAPCPCGSGKKYKHCHGRMV
jgi:preprotein translocase subunit SecA